jgi:hypothetical protein
VQVQVDHVYLPHLKTFSSLWALDLHLLWEDWAISGHVHQDLVGWKWNWVQGEELGGWMEAESFDFGKFAVIL